MTPVLQSGPAIEPLSLIEAKNWLRIDHGDDDVLILALLTAARLVIEAHTQLLLIEQSWRLILDKWPQQCPLTIPLRPLISLDAIRVADADGASILVPPQNYLLSLTPQMPRLHFSKNPPASGIPLSGIEMDVTAGFGPAAADVPAELIQAIR